MEDRVLFANIGWMTHYRGYSNKDKIVGGGSHRNDDKHETFNFSPINGKCYGYVQPVNWGGISINRIDKTFKKGTESINNVLVVWIAKHPQAGGTYIVGWYKHATVFSSIQKSTLAARNKYGYNVLAKENDCTLLPSDQRSYQIPRAKTQGEGFLGQSNVWYADASNKNVQKFRKEVLDYVNSYSKNKRHVSRQILKVDPEARKQVENAAVNYVTKEYEKLGYKVTSREKDNIGWDLDAVKNKIHLKLEVKGVSQSQVSVRITGHEHDSMMENKDSYRLCVVTNAIKNPTLIVFVWDEAQKEWVSDEDENIILKIEVKPSYLATVE